MQASVNIMSFTCKDCFKQYNTYYALQNHQNASNHMLCKLQFKKKSDSKKVKSDIRTMLLMEMENLKEDVRCKFNNIQNSITESIFEFLPPGDDVIKECRAIDTMVSEMLTPSFRKITAELEHEHLVINMFVDKKI